MIQSEVSYRKIFYKTCEILLNISRSRYTLIAKEWKLKIAMKIFKKAIRM